MNDLFHKIAATASEVVGSTWAFILALVLILVWVLTGPLLHFSNTWQLIINTGTTLATFLIVFLIQNTQNRESKATQIKLDELLTHLKGARNSLVGIEEISDEELEKLQEQFRKLHEHYSKEIEKRKKNQKS